MRFHYEIRPDQEIYQLLQLLNLHQIIFLFKHLVNIRQITN